MIRAVRCLNCNVGITFETVGNQIRLTDAAICYNKITKQYVGMCRHCYDKMLSKNKRIEEKKG